MSKNILVVGVGLFVVLLLLAVYIRYTVVANFSGVATTTTVLSSGIAVNAATGESTSKSLTPPVKVPFTFPGGSRQLTVNVPGTASVIQFGYYPDQQRRNSAFDIYVGTQEVTSAQSGSPAGDGPYSVEFSPSNKYVAFRTEQISSAYGEDATVNIIDIPHAQAFGLPPVHTKSDYPIDPIGYQRVMDFYEYSWNADDTLNVTFYDVGLTVRAKNSDPEEYYRISHKELWRYDINTKKYTYIQTLPE